MPHHLPSSRRLHARSQKKKKPKASDAAEEEAPAAEAEEAAPDDDDDALDFSLKKKKKVRVSRLLFAICRLSSCAAGRCTEKAQGLGCR